jgi:hypothetical protein
MMQKADQFQPLAKLGTHDGTLATSEKDAATKCVGCLYGKAVCDSLNDLRCEIAKKKSVIAKKLPPTDDSFKLHLQRCIYQLMTWREATIPMHEVRDPTEFGFEKTPEGAVNPKLMNQAPAAPELLNDLVCNCRAISCATKCSCLCNGQPCTAACNCSAMSPRDAPDESLVCANPLTHDALVDSDSDAESSSDDN